MIYDNREEMQGLRPEKKKQGIEHAGEKNSMKVSMIIQAHFYFKKIATMGKSTPKTVIFCTHCFTFSLRTTTNS